MAELTSRRYSTNAQSWRGGRKAELIQDGIGPCWVNHCDITTGGGSSDRPDRTLRLGGAWNLYENECHGMRKMGVKGVIKA